MLFFLHFKKNRYDSFFNIFKNLLYNIINFNNNFIFIL